MANTDYRPKAGDFGEQHIAVGRTLPTAVIVATDTVRHYLPIVASEIALASMTEMLYYKGGALVFGGTASSTAGTVTARIVKREASGPTFTPISATVTIPSGSTAGDVLAFPILNTATDNERTIRPNAGDSLVVEVTASSTVTTQPGDVQAAVKLAVLR
jgi:hypothetical protein